MRKLVWSLGGVVVLLGAYLSFWPVAFDPVAWNPPPAPEVATNDALAKVERVGSGLRGPEGLAVDAQGRVYGGLEDGRIVRIGRDSVETIANTGGRPLGMQFDASGNLIVADGRAGLLSISTGGTISVLATEHGGLRFGFTDDLDIAKDGTIYFSDASWKFGVGNYRNDALEHRPNGRLLAYRDGKVELVKDGLYFPNGVALAADDSYVLVNETWEYRITRVWLSGEKKGQSDVFAMVPGFPDNLTRAEDGTFWCALFAPRNPMLDRLAGKPFLRKVIARLPSFVQPQPARHAWVVGIDASGTIVHDLQHADADSYSPITSAVEHGGKLWLGSLSRDTIAVADAP